MLHVGGNLFGRHPRREFININTAVTISPCPTCVFSQNSEVDPKVVGLPLPQNARQSSRRVLTRLGNFLLLGSPQNIYFWVCLPLDRIVDQCLPHPQVQYCNDFNCHHDFTQGRCYHVKAFRIMETFFCSENSFLARRLPLHKTKRKCVFRQPGVHSRYGTTQTRLFAPQMQCPAGKIPQDFATNCANPWYDAERIMTAFRGWINLALWKASRNHPWFCFWLSSVDRECKRVFFHSWRCMKEWVWKSEWLKRRKERKRCTDGWNRTCLFVVLKGVNVSTIFCCMQNEVLQQREDLSIAKETTCAAARGQCNALWTI